MLNWQVVLYIELNLISHANPIQSLSLSHLIRNEICLITQSYTSSNDSSLSHLSRKTCTCIELMVPFENLVVLWGTCCIHACSSEWKYFICTLSLSYLFPVLRNWPYHRGISAQISPSLKSLREVMHLCNLSTHPSDVDKGPRREVESG